MEVRTEARGRDAESYVSLERQLDPGRVTRPSALLNSRSHQVRWLHVMELHSRKGVRDRLD